MRELSATGKRLRHLRVERGLTQTEVTGGEYSKEYVSQVERGKTVPSRRAIELFAKHLDVDESYFETGVDSIGRERFEGLLAAGEVLTARGEAEEALAVFERARAIATRADNLAYVWRADTGRAWALHVLGRHPEALDLLAGARAYHRVAAPEGRELAQVQYRLGCVREAVGDLQSALGLFEETLHLLGVGEQPGNSLRLQALARMASIHLRRHDLVAAAEAAQAALDVGRGIDGSPSDRRCLVGSCAGRGAKGGLRAVATSTRCVPVTCCANWERNADTARVQRDLGIVRTRMGAAGEALACFDKGLETTPHGRRSDDAGGIAQRGGDGQTRARRPRGRVRDRRRQPGCARRRSLGGDARRAMLI